MRIAVTGGAGYVGPWLMAELSARGHEVHGQDLVAPRNCHRAWATFRTFDLGTQERISWLRHIGPDVVVHLAALYGRVWGETDMIKTAAANAGLTAVTARDSAAHGARLMYMSSSEVYGRSADYGPVGPHAQLFPLNMYGLSKKWGEEAAKVYAPAGLMVTRLNMPYGPSYCLPDPGEIPHTSGRPGSLGYNVLHSMVWEAEHGFDIKVHRGTKRCLTYIGDSVRGLATILESGQSGTWNVCRNDDHITTAELARRVVEMTSSTSSIHEEDPPERVTMRKELSNLGLLEMGWQPEVSIDEGMKITWEYYRRFDRTGAWRG